MINIKISDNLKRVCPYLRLGLIQSDIEYQKENLSLWAEIEKTIYQIKNSISKEQITGLTVIQDTREAYLAMGKEPARYRCSAEALLRRIIKGKDLYKINNIVDIINLISISSQFSIGCYDYNQLVEPIIFDIGWKDEIYQTIGRGTMNINNLPVFRDSIGAFGSPTSDSERTMVTSMTKNILVAIIDFNGDNSLEETLENTVFYLKQYANAKEPNYYTV